MSALERHENEHETTIVISMNWNQVFHRMGELKAITKMLASNHLKFGTFCELDLN